MKKIILFIFLLQSITVFSQENIRKKHNLLFDIGINHTSYFKPVYFPAYKHYMHKYAETLYPGEYTHPQFNYKSNITYRYNFKKRLSFNAGLNSSYMRRTKTISADSVAKYYLYPDSIKDVSPFYQVNAPIYNKETNLDFGANIRMGYNIKRFHISLGFLLNVYNMRWRHSKYVTEEIYNDEYFNFYSTINYLLRIEALVVKTKIPISIYIESSNRLFGGIIINF